MNIDLKEYTKQKYPNAEYKFDAINDRNYIDFKNSHYDTFHCNDDVFEQFEIVISYINLSVGKLIIDGIPFLEMSDSKIGTIYISKKLDLHPMYFTFYRFHNCNIDKIYQPKKHNFDLKDSKVNKVTLKRHFDKGSLKYMNCLTI